MCLYAQLVSIYKQYLNIGINSALQVFQANYYSDKG